MFVLACILWIAADRLLQTYNLYKFEQTTTISRRLHVISIQSKCRKLKRLSQKAWLSREQCLIQ